MVACTVLTVLKGVERFETQPRGRCDVAHIINTLYITVLRIFL